MSSINYAVQPEAMAEGKCMNARNFKHKGETAALRLAVTKDLVSGMSQAAVHEKYAALGAGPRASETIVRFRGIVGKELSTTAKIDLAMLKYLDLGIKPTEAQINVQVGRAEDIPIRKERWGDAKSFLPSYRMLQGLANEALVEVIQKRQPKVQEVFNGSLMELEVRPWGEHRKGCKQVMPRSENNPNVVAEKREDRAEKYLRTLRPEATIERFTASGSEAIGADFRATENGTVDLYDSKGWTNFTAHEYETVLANVGHYWMITAVNGKMGHLLVDPNNLRQNPPTYCHRPVVAKKEENPTMITPLTEQACVC